MGWISVVVMVHTRDLDGCGLTRGLCGLGRRERSADSWVYSTYEGDATLR